MSNGILIGIDAGTTVFKAAAFHAGTGKLLAAVQRSLPVLSPKPGWQETPVSAFDAALDATMRQLQREVGARWKNIAGIGVSAQGGSTIVVDGESGEALTNMMLWSDTRGDYLGHEIRSKKPATWWRNTMLNNWMPAGLARLRWLKTHQSSICNRKNSKFVGAGEYLFHKFTGKWFQDAGSALQIGSYRPSTAEAAKGPVFDLIPGLRKSQFAPLRNGHRTFPVKPDALVKYRIPNDNVPVAGPYMDQEAGFQSISGLSKQPLQVSLGTAWVGNFKRPVRNPGFAGLQFVVPSDYPNEPLIILPLLTGNSAWNWGLDRFVDSRRESAIAAAEQIFRSALLPPDGMTCIPWFTQSNLTESSHFGAGTFYGVGTNATREDFIRALACGMCFELMRVFQELKDACAIDSVVLSGGSAKSRHFRTCIATLFAPIPVFVQQNEDTAASRGALVAFNAAMSKSPVKRVSPLRGEAAIRIIAAYDLYLDTYTACVGDHPLGLPLSLQRKVR